MSRVQTRARASHASAAATPPPERRIARREATGKTGTKRLTLTIRQHEDIQTFRWKYQLDAANSRRDLVLLLVGLGKGDSLDKTLGGVTCLQKFCVLEKEAGLPPSGDGFSFIPYKAGRKTAQTIRR